MFEELCQQIIEQLRIDIDLFFKDLEKTTTQGTFEELDKIIICHSLLGNTPDKIAKIRSQNSQNIRDRLSKNIYPRINELIITKYQEFDLTQKEGKWLKILNFLLSKNGYRLNPPLQLNDDNFQASFGRQMFIYPPNQKIVESQIEGTKFYQSGLYYQAIQCFLHAWQLEQKIYQTGNPEVLIYLINCLIEYQKSLLEQQEFKIYTLAVVVPFYHNQGQVATEILRGIAQIQLQINLPILEKISDNLGIKLNDIKPQIFGTLNNNADSKILLKILIVNDPNNLYASDNQTAEKLVKLAIKLNLIAVIGHYSSEMTKKALKCYSENGLVLINPSSTSNEFSNLSKGESLSFFRLSTQDSIAAKSLIDYLFNKFNTCETPQQVALIYNKNSSYSTSYKNDIKKYLNQYETRFKLLEECDYLSENFYQIQSYLTRIEQEKVDIIIIIPDGGIEPNSLNNTGLISRLKLRNCLIAGSATFYHNNVLHWIDELNPNECNIISCIPWHGDSQKNGCNSDNKIAQSFCEIGEQLWGKNHLTWRSATAFDCGLIIFRILEKDNNINNSQNLLAEMDQYFKQKQQEIIGVTGKIKFLENGDRHHSPTEIVAIQKEGTYWQWKL